MKGLKEKWYKRGFGRCKELRCGAGTQQGGFQARAKFYSRVINPAEQGRGWEETLTPAGAAGRCCGVSAVLRGLHQPEGKHLHPPALSGESG